MNNSYLVPANAKKGTLILNMFLPFDVIMFGTGIVISLILVTFVSSANILIVLLACLPALVTGLLVVPIPNYHNVRVAIICIFKFYMERKRFIWKGWCFYEKFVEESNKSTK